MITWYTRVLKHYFVLTGRARRREYWYFFLANTLVGFAYVFICGFISSFVQAFTQTGPQAHIELPFLIPYYLYCLAIVPPSFAVTIRRLHDTGRSGWWCALALVPILGSLVLTVVFVFDSQPGTNKYGPNPKLESSTEMVAA